MPHHGMGMCCKYSDDTRPQSPISFSSKPSRGGGRGKSQTKEVKLRVIYFARYYSRIDLPPLSTTMIAILSKPRRESPKFL